MNSTLSPRKKKPSSKKRPARKARRKLPAWFLAERRALPPGLERDTILLPFVIADSVVIEAGRFLGVDLPADYADRLAAKADRIYLARPGSRFWRQMRARSNAGRDALYMFMRHWLSGLLLRERPALFRRLPVSFHLGRPLVGPARYEPGTSITA